MKRPTRWYWAASIALAVYVLLSSFTRLLIVGIGSGAPNGPLWSAWLALGSVLDVMLGEHLAPIAETFLWGAPPFLGALFVYCRLRPRGKLNDGYLHCINCGYILKGLNEPRCPECGEGI